MSIVTVVGRSRRVITGSSPGEGAPPLAVKTLVYLYFLLAPVYLWASGLPQIAHGILVALVALRVVVRLKRGADRPVESSSFPSVVFYFAFYVTIVNLVATILVGDTSFLRTTVFYVYNAMVAITFFGLVREYGSVFRSVVFSAAVLSITIQLVSLVAQGGLGGAGRQTIGFNNPNQLGAFAVLMYAVILAAAESSKVQAFLAGAMLPVSTLLILASLSRAAMMTLPILVISYIAYLRNTEISNHDRRATLLVVSAAVLAAWLAVRERISSGLLNAVDDRWGVQKADSTLSGRGYDRIMDHPEFWPFGGGEGAHYRFGMTIELHSGVGTLMYAYGAVGVALFFLAAYYAARTRGWLGVILVAAPLVYGLTHQVLRNTLLWVLLSVLAAQYDQYYRRGRSTRSRPSLMPPLTGGVRAQPASRPTELRSDTCREKSR